MSTGYSKEMLEHVCKYFGYATNRQSAIHDGTFPAIVAKVRASCKVYDMPLPYWAEE